MRRVIIQGTPPAEWIEKAEALSIELRNAPNDIERKAILDTKANQIWRDPQVRDWLLGQFSNKCWYTEAQEAVSSIHVDHFRPKGAVINIDGDEESGYWWLAYNYNNYITCGELINVKKRHHFPLLGGIKAIPEYVPSIDGETTGLIDPRTHDARLISYELEGEEDCIAVSAARISAEDIRKANLTIDILGLNRLPRLNTKRRIFWDDCEKIICDYVGASGTTPLKELSRAMSVTRLRSMIEYRKEFSSVVEACIRKKAPEPMIAEVFART